MCTHKTPFFATPLCQCKIIASHRGLAFATSMQTEEKGLRVVIESCRDTPLHMPSVLSEDAPFFLWKQLDTGFNCFQKPVAKPAGLGRFASGMSNASQRGSFLPHHSAAYMAAIFSGICPVYMYILAKVLARLLSLARTLSLLSLLLSRSLLSRSLALSLSRSLALLLSHTLSRTCDRARSHFSFSLNLSPPPSPLLSRCSFSFLLLFLLVVISLLHLLARACACSIALSRSPASALSSSERFSPATSLSSSLPPTRPPPFPLRPLLSFD